MKPLTNAQYDLAEQMARDRLLKKIQSRLGEKPMRDKFQRELPNPWNWLDILLGIIFFAAFVISSIHIVQFMGHVAYIAPELPTIGIYIPRGLSAGLQQVFSLLMADTAMIFFFVQSRLYYKTNLIMSTASFAVSIATGAFVVGANWSSGQGLISFLPPILSIIGGWRIEQIMVTILQVKQEVDDQYRRMVLEYEKRQEQMQIAMQDVTSHPMYREFLLQSVWQHFATHNRKINSEVDEILPEEQARIAAHEVDRRDWSKYVHIKEIAANPPSEGKNDQSGNVTEIAITWLRDNPEHNPKITTAVTYGEAARRFEEQFGRKIGKSTLFGAAAKASEFSTNGVHREPESI